jgi:hypothetical protein
MSYMFRALLQFRLRTPAETSGAPLIALGLAVLLASTWIPIAPVLTAMAILALGATNITLARFHGSPALYPVLLLHAGTYLTLYALFLGASLHATAAASTAGPDLWQVFDLAVSIIPMAAAAQRMGGMLSRR